MLLLLIVSVFNVTLYIVLNIQCQAIVYVFTSSVKAT